MKSRILSYLVVIATALLLIPSASATWSNFRSLGKTTVVGEPCVQLAAAEVMCVAQSRQHTLMANQFSVVGLNNLALSVTGP